MATIHCCRKYPEIRHILVSPETDNTKTRQRFLQQIISFLFNITTWVYKINVIWHNKASINAKTVNQNCPTIHDSAVFIIVSTIQKGALQKTEFHLISSSDKLLIFSRSISNFPNTRSSSHDNVNHNGFDDPSLHKSAFICWSSNLLLYWERIFSTIS